MTYTAQQIADAEMDRAIAVEHLIDADILVAQERYAEATERQASTEPRIAHAARVLGTTTVEIDALWCAALVARCRAYPAVAALFPHVLEADEPEPAAPADALSDFDHWTAERALRAEAAAFAGILNPQTKVTRRAFDFPISQAVHAIDADTLTAKLVVFGTADTFYTCPARTADGTPPTIYGAVTVEERDDAPYDRYYVFRPSDDQRAANASYRASVKS